VREKIVAAASASMIVIADQSKWVAKLGHFALPIEVTPLAIRDAASRGKAIAAMGEAGS